MSKSAPKNSKATLTVTADQVLAIIDMSMYNGIAVQLNGIGSTAGSMKLQHSNDQKLWSDISGATLTLAANVANIINQPNIYAGSVRILVTLSNGAGSYDYAILAKEH